MAVVSRIGRKFASVPQSPAQGAIFFLAFILLVISGFSAVAQSFTFQQVAALTNAPPPPANPAGGLILGTDGNFYGTSFAGGQFGLGTVFQMTPTGYVTVMVSFNGANGANPRGTLVADKSGNLYGVTYGGGMSNAGTVFKMPITFGGSLTVLHDFYADPGQNPYAGLLMGADGNLYGTTESYGMVFKITPSGVFSNLTTYFGLNGLTLDSVLGQGSDGSLYGVAGLTGFSAQGCGRIMVATNGAGAAFGPLGGSSGDQPFSGLVPWGSNAYVGTGAGGGTYGMGSLFFVTNTSSSILASVSFNGTNGAYPYALPLLVGSSVYGGTAAGGTYGQGVVFKYNINQGTLTTTSLAGTNGSGVYGGFIRGTDGFIYGTTRFGGTNGRGTVFRMDTNGNNLTNLTSFPATPPPDAGIIQAPNGNFYVVLAPIELYGGPAILQLTPGGTLSAFAGLPGTTFDSSLLASQDGNLYATTFDGGNYNQGTVTRIPPQAIGSTIIFSFRGTSGANPFAGLIQGTDGFLYGTTVNGGLGNGGAGYGTAFAMTTNGVQEMGADFTGANGANPYAPLVQGEDGSFYGTTYAGGTNNLGTVFQVTSSGQLTSLYSFSGPDGANPYGGLIQGPDGFLYGMTTYGGLTNGTNASGFGTVFQMSTNGGALNTLAYFNGTNGANPRGSLVLGPDGNYYGTTLAGGAANDGTVFSVSTGGTLTTIYSFSGMDGASPYAGLFFGSDGALYGVTTAGGSAGGGSIFRIAMPPMLQLSLVGGQVQLAWPVFDSEFQLQSSSDLNNPTGWAPVTSAISTNGNQVMVLQPASANNVFYRLVNP